METKQVIVFRKDLLKGEHGIRKGKFGGQVAHASVQSLLSLFNRKELDDNATVLELQYTHGSVLDDWLNGLYTKVIVSVNSEAELMAIKECCDEVGLPNALITDAGKTEFNGVPTVTCLGIGPCLAEDVDRITGGLPLL